MQRRTLELKFYISVAIAIAAVAYIVPGKFSHHASIRTAEKKFGLDSLNDGRVTWDGSTFHGTGETYDFLEQLDRNILRSLLVDTPDSIVKLQEMRSRWIDLCIENSKPDDMDKFSLSKVVDSICQEDTWVAVVPDDYSPADGPALEWVAEADQELIISELELRRLWDSLKVQAAKNLDAVSLLLSPVTAPLISAGVVPFSTFSSASGPALGGANSVAAGAGSDAESSSASLSSSSNVLRLGKALNTEFSVQDALLLLEDEDSFGIFTPESDFTGSSESSSQGSTGIAQFDMSEYATSEAVDSEFWDRDAALEEEEEEAELVVTAQELERLWTARQEADPWSARAAFNSSPFDMEEALLLLAGGVDGLVNDAAEDDLYPADALRGMDALMESETDEETERESERELEAGDYRQLEYVPAADNSRAAEEFERLTSLGTSCPTPRARALHSAVSRAAAAATASAAPAKAFTTPDGIVSEMSAGVGRDRDMDRDMDDLEIALLEADARESASEIYTKNLYLTALTELDTANTSVDAISQRLIAHAAAAAASSSGSSPSTTSSSASVQDVVRRINRDLDDTTYFRPAWQKERDFLSPDIDTQIFEGDIMFSNTYLTQRIPANWDDPEKDEMSENYLACGTMAMPGEPETDFDVKVPIWEEAQLPVGPQFVEDPEETLEVPSPQYVEQEYKDRILARTKQGAIRKLVELAKSFIIDPETVQIGNDGRLRIGIGRKAKKTNPASGADLYISSVYAPPETGEFTDRAVKELPPRPPSSSHSGATTPEGGTGAGIGEENEKEKQSTTSSGESFSVEAWREKSATDYDMYLLTTYDSHDLENDPIVRQQIRRPPAADPADGESHRTSKSGVRDSADERFGLLCSDDVASDPFDSVAGAAAVGEGGNAGDAGYEGESSMLDAFFDSFAEQDSGGEGAAREEGGGMAVAGDGLGSDAAGKARESDGTEVAKVGEGGKLTTSSSASGGVRVGDGSADDLIYEPDELAHLQAMETAQVSSTREVAMEEYEDSTVGLEEEGPPRRSLKWRTPRAWLRRPGFANHVGYEIWGNYNPAAFEVIDDHVWDDDAFTLQSVHYLNSITDLYLTDHAEANKHIDERKYWERVLVSQYKSNAKAAAAATATAETGVEAGAGKGGKGKGSKGGKKAKKDEAVAAVTAAADQARLATETKQTAATMTVDGLPVIEGIVGMKSLPDDNGDPLPDGYRERVPSFYTPDSDRGVLYNDEVVEMKGKMVLHAYQSPPSIAFENDSFAYNEEMDTMNQIGSCRDQYDWTPTLPTVDQVRELPTGAVDMHRGVEIATAAMGISLNSPQVEEAELDAKVVLRILPLIFFANHVANLKSTKDNVLIFEYGGVMRHLPGIRAAMLSVAKQCIPELEDLRLETRRKADKFDY